MKSATAQYKMLPTYSLTEGSPNASSMFDIFESSGEFKKRKANFLVPHRKDYYLLVLVKEGSSRHWVDFVPYTLKPGAFYFSVPHHVQMKEKAEPLHGILLSFTNEFLNLEENRFLKQLPLISNPDNQHELQLSPADILFIDDIMQKMLAEFKAHQGWQNAMLLSYLRVLLIYTSRLYTLQFENASSSQRQLLKKFHTLVDTHFTTCHQVADYAKLMQITPGYLSDLIKEQSGKNAIDQIHERIMLEAKRHLLHTEWTMKEIAFSIGFEDAAYFNRFFKRIESITPAAYRTAIRKMYH